MKFSTREDIAAPIDAVFEQVSDFDGFQRAVLRRGAEVSRQDQRESPGTGMRWAVTFDWRRKRRRAVVVLSEWAPPARLLFDVEGQAFVGTCGISLIALSPRRTRVLAEVEFRPKTFAARLIIQSLRMTRARQNRRFKEGIAGLARRIEAGHASGRAGFSPWT